MNPAVAAMKAADWQVLSLNLLRFAHDEIARYKWRGLRVQVSAQGRLSVNGMGPEDFIAEAQRKLLDGTRTYRPDLDIETNLTRTIKSGIWNHAKRSRGQNLQDDRTQADVEEGADDPCDVLPDAKLETADGRELVRRQREILDALTKSIEHDEELSALYLAYESGVHKNAEIQAMTGIAAARVSEVKRKFRQHAEKFIRQHPQYADAVEFA